MVGAAKAWVNFNRTGTVAIRASFNVTSVTDNGVGLYTVNITNAFSDTNFAPTVTTAFGAGSSFGFALESVTTNSISISTRNTSNAAGYDPSIVVVVAHR